MGKNVLLAANTSWYLYNFRRPLCRALQARGLHPILLAPRDAYSERLIQEGFDWREHFVPTNRLNPLQEFRSLLGFIRYYRQSGAISAHHFTSKCMVYGTIAAVVARVPYRINAVTGLGHVFLSKGKKGLLLRAAVSSTYRLLFGVSNSRVIFQNPDDQKAFIDQGLVKASQTSLIRSSGVDLSAFKPSERTQKKQNETLKIVFASRLLREKGLFELMEAMRILKSQRGLPPLSLIVAGNSAMGNPSSISQEQIDAWSQEGIAEFIGHIDDVATLLAGCDLVVLPSYREGTPRILLEACAMEIAVVTTDVPGCRQVVENGKNGLLVESHSAQSLADAIAQLVRDPALRESMGKQGRKKVEAEFSDLEIARQTLTVYEELGVLKS